MAKNQVEGVSFTLQIRRDMLRLSWQYGMDESVREFRECREFRDMTPYGVRSNEQQDPPDRVLLILCMALHQS